MSVVLKLIVAVALFLVLIVAAGVSGLTFYVWPTNVSDRPLAITPQVLDQLARMKVERKFIVDKDHFYFGAPSEEARASSQAAVDAVISSLQSELPANPRRSAVLRIFKHALAAFDSPESEERDQFIVYLERIMSIVGISSSGELLNVWRYGFPYGWVRRA